MKRIPITLLIVVTLLFTILIGCSKQESKNTVGSVATKTEEVTSVKEEGSIVSSVPEYTGPVITMKVAWAETADPNSHPVSAGMTVFKSTVEGLTGGKLKVELYPGGQLGDAKSMLEQVEHGIIHSCASIPSGLIAGSYYDVFNIFDIPYLFRSDMVTWETLNPSTSFFKEIADNMADYTGIRPVGFFMEGRRHFTNSVREIKKPQDLKGLKIRTMEVPAHMEMVKAMGGTPTPVSWLELYSALQTGVVDGQENPILNIQYLNAPEVQKYLTLDGHITLLNVWTVNEAWFKDLPLAIQVAIKEAVYQSLIVCRGISELSNTLGVKELEEDGMQVYTPTKAELEEFQKVTQEAVLPWVEKNISDKYVLERMMEELKNTENRLINL
ncbi:MAG: DctP family TRAP transporter solute-binding subunit [Peptostreptococcales bacterium]|jgi:tripartite ATP-independent transporter DctP family solute receptor